ncbi:MAG: hypothetical protein HOV84_27700 [Streptomyces sp.]|nr:hypothetical protein [Streptomyces sp.]
MASTLTRRPRAGRVAVAGLAAFASLGLLGTAAPATAAPAAPKAVVGKDKYGKWTKTGPALVDCRVYVAVSAGRTVNATASGTCKFRMSQTVVAGITINGRVKYITARGTGKKVYTDVVKVNNPRGKQTICGWGYVNSPLDETNPRRSEARTCFKA